MLADFTMQLLSSSIENDHTFAIANAQHVQGMMRLASPDRDRIGLRLLWWQIEAVHVRSG
jgi:hypothetical protein